ncbi:hypothetical protein ZWY2020_051033 [Hordeum vulgare]|nr:hypothetical protein ZWY2020_051033 [Hordeum vulgare]
MGVIDPAMMTMDFGNERVLGVNHAEVYHIFGFPMGPRTTPMHATSGHDDSLSTLKNELGFNRSQSIGVKALVQKLAELVTVDLTVKVFFLILYQNLMCPGCAVRLGRVVAMVENMDYTAMVQMHFRQLVVDELQFYAHVDAMSDIPDERGPDEVIQQGYSFQGKYLFGNLQIWEAPVEASGDNAYYHPPVGLCGIFYAGPSSYVVFYERICSQIPACDVEPPPTCGFMARRMFDSRSSSAHAFVGGKKYEEVDELLVKVLKLTEELPTSRDMLRILLNFPLLAMAPHEEDIVATHNLDRGFLEGLKIAVTNIRSSFSQLNDSQEVKCARYEKDVEHILEKMNRHDAGVADDNAGLESAGIDASGDIGLGHPGVSSCDVHKDSYNGTEKD